MTLIERIAAKLTDDQLVANIETLNATLDSFVAEKLTADPEREASFRQDLVLRNALRAEYRTRTGEVI